MQRRANLPGLTKNSNMGIPNCGDVVKPVQIVPQASQFDFEQHVPVAPSDDGTGKKTSIVPRTREFMV